MLPLVLGGLSAMTGGQGTNHFQGEGFAFGVEAGFCVGKKEGAEEG